MVRILVADDHDIARKGIIQTLVDIPSFQVTAEAETGEQTLRLLRQQSIDVLLLDISMPDLDGLQVLEQLNASDSKVPVLILTQHEEEPYIVQAFKLGAMGYVHKQRAAEELEAAIHTLLKQQTYLSPSLSGQVARKLKSLNGTGGVPDFSPREFQVVRLAASGQSAGEIAHELHLTPQAVTAYRSRIKKKLGFRNFEQVIVYAVKNGLV